MARIIFILNLIIFSIYSENSAACTQGQLIWTGGNMQYCYDGTNSRVVDSTSIASGCGTAGQIQFSSPDLLFCDGTVWRRMQGPTVNAACGSPSGYFYFDTVGQYYWMCNGANWMRIP